MADEDPSEADVERFGGDAAHCPACGAEVYDEAPKCPACGEWIEGDAAARPGGRGRRRLFVAAVAVITAAAFLIVYGLL